MSEAALHLSSSLLVVAVVAAVFLGAGMVAILLAEDFVAGVVVAVVV